MDEKSNSYEKEK